ncbi:N-acetylmuramoyl-L-alanine amidase [Bacillus cereus]|uniref:N-acetylmuramoyl-L-alanine amidase n=1 Tax=Bacillus cereus TaxID=1396 RepID=A0A9X7G8H9_BACCE|nr:N-acetylmuramoyl-L-alanine amidase [Bacillus cereus]PED41289.1 N-acetylmuramoyl-L-alanine amidase [Bacillus cereus]PFV08645.1 N-acetylmuramoyl-L-alanine amidase [Bacillus cereus]
MEIRKKLVDPSKYGTKCPYTMNPEFITIHNTYNDASAKNEIAYMITNNNEVSFHIAVDDKAAVQGIPLERNAWACGDGNGSGNRKSISVEICFSKSGGDKYYKAEENAAEIVAQLMKLYNIPISKIRTHQSWSGKYCPHRMLAEKRWNHFIDMVQRTYNGNNNELTPEPIPPVTNETGVAYIEGYNVNLRKGPGTNYAVIRKLQKGESYKVWGRKGYWLNLGGDQWIYDDSSYIRFEKDGNNSTENSVAGKRVESKVDNLRFYSRPSWADRDVAGTVNKGLGFEIIDKVDVQGSPQYKVKNSIGNIYHITASEKFVEVD